MEPVIDLQNVSKRFDGIPAVSNVNFHVDAGEAVALVGPSGSGKTTLLRLIAGFEVPDDGQITLSGRTVSRKRWACPPHERGIGMVFQKPALWPHMTLAGNIRFGLSGLDKRQSEERFRRLVSITHLEGLEKRYPHQVSGGEAQRAALARALAPNPPILLLDEPMSGIDWELNREMIELIAEIRRQSGTTIIYVSHDLSEAQAVTDRVILLRRGEIAYAGSWAGVPWRNRAV